MPDEDKEHLAPKGFVAELTFGAVLAAVIRHWPLVVAFFTLILRRDNGPKVSPDASIEGLTRAARLANETGDTSEFTELLRKRCDAGMCKL